MALEMVMPGNFDEKSLALAAILTATWRHGFVDGGHLAPGQPPRWAAAVGLLADECMSSGSAPR